jgi:hypothetical protein
VHVLRGVRQEVAVLVNRAALDRKILAPQRHKGSNAAEGRIVR